MVVWPTMLITCIGAISITFLIACARLSELELQSSRLQRRIDEQLAARNHWRRAVSQLCDRAALRRFVQEEGMTLGPAATDEITLPPLPPKQWAISPVTPQVQAPDREHRAAYAERELAARRGIAGTAF